LQQIDGRRRHITAIGDVSQLADAIAENREHPVENRHRLDQQALNPERFFSHNGFNLRFAPALLSFPKHIGKNIPEFIDGRFVAVNWNAFAIELAEDP
jgi:hypothetical protein